MARVDIAGAAILSPKHSSERIRATAAIRRVSSFVSSLAAEHETLRTLKNEQHDLIACGPTYEER